MTVLLGGEAGRQFRLKAGDMLVIPAGVGHRLCVAIYESAPSCQPQFCFLVRRRQAPLCSS